MSDASTSNTGSNENALNPAIDATNEVVSQVPQFIDLLPNSWQPYWHFVQKYPIVEALAILFVFWTAAFLIRRYVIQAIE